MNNLLLLHGAIGAKDQLENLEGLLAKEYHIYKLNFSGHGGEPFKSAFNIKQFSEDVLLFMEQHELQQVNVFGYSMGGYVALYLAKHHPSKIGKIITLGTKFKWTSEIAVKEVKMLNAEIIEQKIPAFATALKARHTANLWKEMLSKTATMMLEMGEENPLSLSDYKTIKQSCKLLLADNDEMVSKEETLEVSNALPNATFVSLPNAKHPIEKVDLETLVKEISDTM